MWINLQIAVLYLTILISSSLTKDEPTNTISVTSEVANDDNNTYKSNTYQKLIKLLGKPTNDEQKSLKRVYLSNRSITCNDGSQAGFYLRKSHGSKKWIIFLEGGWYCYDQKTCRHRWLKLRHLMTSTQWPETRDVNGILSNKPQENPFWWNANHVLIPYCTSDSWSGTRSSPSDMFTFMGAEIILQAIKDLVPLGLDNASSLLLAGSSAGGTGVMLNLDHVHSLIHHELGFKHIAIHGVSDSGWFLDRAPYSQVGLPPVDAVKKGMELWKARMPKNCAAKYPHEPWRCYFGYRLYPTLTAPLFVFQWLFDEAQMTVDNVGAPVTKQQWDYIHKMGDSIRQTFENVSAVFAPSCMSHGILTKRDWELVKIDSISLPQSIYCWQKHSINSHRISENIQTIETNQSCAKSLRNLLRSGTTAKGVVTTIGNNTNKIATVVDSNQNKNESKPLIDEKRKRMHNEARSDRINKKNRKRKDRNKRREQNREERNRRRKEKHQRRRNGCKQENSRSGNNHTNTPKRPQRSVVPSRKRKCSGCQFRLIERCTWPQCNHSCPKLQNPVTGDEMDFIDLLKSFGLDMKSVANALGIDMQTLNNMEDNELLNLLTQQTN